MENWTKHPAQGCAGRIANILCKAGRLLRSLFHVLFKTTKYRGPSELLYVVKLSRSKEWSAHCSRPSANRPQNIWKYAKIVISHKCYFLSMKKGAKIETQSAGGGGAKPIVFWVHMLIFVPKPGNHTKTCGLQTDMLFFCKVSFMVRLPKCPDARPQQRANMWNCPNFHFSMFCADATKDCTAIHSSVSSLPWILVATILWPRKNCVIYGEVFNSLHFYNLPPYVYTQFTLFVLFVKPAY